MDDRACELEELYRRRYTAFRNTLATITGGYDSARDAVQETFARALRNHVPGRNRCRASDARHARSTRVGVARTHARTRSTRAPV
jgi:DNA-directed RNA polymerase specialized sigma24 family protein